METKTLQPLIGGDPKASAIDELSFTADRVHKLLISAEETFDGVGVALIGTDVQKSFMRARSLLGLASDILAPMAEHIDALPREARQKAPLAAAARGEGGSSPHFLAGYLAAVKENAVAVQSLLEGAAVLLESGEAQNALALMITDATTKARAIKLALDSVNLPEGASK